MSLVHLLRNAAAEIRNLRRENEILRAKVEVIDVFKAALLGVPGGGGMSPDVAWELDRAINDLEIEQRKADANITVGKADRPD